MSTTTAADAGVSAFLEQFLIAVDFQKPVEVLEGTKLSELPEWDSLAALGVIVMCDTDYGVAITGPDLATCTTVGDIFACVVRKQAG
jgi:acyl carrier protein